MPLFESDSVRALVGDHAMGERVLGLQRVSLSDAKSAIAQILEPRHSHDFTSFLIYLDPVTATRGETLFPPLGRQLLDASKRGLIGRIYPLTEANRGGFYVELPGHPQTEKGQQ